MCVCVCTLTHVCAGFPPPAHPMDSTTALSVCLLCARAGNISGALPIAGPLVVRVSVEHIERTGNEARPLLALVKQRTPKPACGASICCAPGAVQLCHWKEKEQEKGQFLSSGHLGALGGIETVPPFRTGAHAGMGITTCVGWTHWAPGQVRPQAGWSRQKAAACSCVPWVKALCQLLWQHLLPQSHWVLGSQSSPSSAVWPTIPGCHVFLFTIHGDVVA